MAANFLRYTTLWTLVLLSTEQFEAKPNNCLPTQFGMIFIVVYSCFK
jgi:hypothetical protein